MEVIELSIRPVTGLDYKIVGDSIVKQVIVDFLIENEVIRVKGYIDSRYNILPMSISIKGGEEYPIGQGNLFVQELEEYITIVFKETVEECMEVR